jgi:hypothetical protein
MAKMGVKLEICGEIIQKWVEFFKIYNILAQNAQKWSNWTKKRPKKWAK